MLALPSVPYSENNCLGGGLRSRSVLRSFSSAATWWSIWQHFYKSLYQVYESQYYVKFFICLQGYITMCTIFAVLIFAFTIACVVLYVLRVNNTAKRICIVVLGDIGRSPRMQYHALSFASMDWNVDLIGYDGSTPHADLLKCARIKCCYMKETPTYNKKLPKLAVYASKVIWQSVSLMYHLFTKITPSYILVQNPPAIPTLSVLCLFSLLRGSRLVVDWHNYGFTILALSLGTAHPFTFFAKCYEHIFGYFSYANICVTDAMRIDLRENWGIKATTMHDRPPRMFKSIDVDTKHDLFVKLREDIHAFTGPEDRRDDVLKQITMFTEMSVDGHVTMRTGRPALLVSSTSWTADEDFSVLLNALQSYEITKENDPNCQLPDLLCAITGKGPEKSFYTGLLKNKQWKYVTVITPWLAAEDYPLLLGSADIGVCLHTSSSGLDLPMKVVDMFGCGLPVCAFYFPCIVELVRHNHNGLVFSCAAELAAQLQLLLKGFPRKCDLLDTFRDNLKAFQSLRWQQEWESNVFPIFSKSKVE